MIGEFTWLQWALMLAVSLGSGFVHGFVGIGYPLVATPLFALIFSFQRAVPLLVIPTIAAIVCTFFAFGRAVDWRESLRRYWPLVVTSPIGVWFGTKALLLWPAQWLMLILAAVITVFLVLDRKGASRIDAMVRHPTVFAFPFGLVAGLCEGAVNVSGPMLLIYFLLLDLPAVSIIAILNALFLFGKLVQSGVLVSQGVVDAGVLQAALPLVGTMVAAFVVGVRLRGRFDSSRYRGWLKATLGLMVALLLFNALG